MKKIIITLVLLVPSLFFAQSVFDKFDGQDNVTAVIVNKKMFEMMSKVKVDDKDAQQYMNLLKKLDNLKVFTTENTKIASDMKNTVNSYLKSSNLEELMRVTDGGKNVKIYIRSGANANIVRELLMYIDGSGKETIVLSLTGNFDLDEISTLTEKMNLPGGDELKKASKK